MNFKKVLLFATNYVNALAYYRRHLLQKVRLQRLNYVKPVLTYLVRYHEMNYVNALDKKRLYGTLNYVKHNNNYVNALITQVRYVNPLYI